MGTKIPPNVVHPASRPNSNSSVATGSSVNQNTASPARKAQTPANVSQNNVTGDLL